MLRTVFKQRKPPKPLARLREKKTKSEIKDLLWLNHEESENWTD